MTKNSTTSAFGFAFSRQVLKRTLLIALIVGCILSLANQLDIILSGQFTAGLSLKLLANFLTPFAVSSISAVINRKTD